MPIGTKTSRVALTLAVGAFAAALSGCESVRDAMGASKAPPDEFAVLTAAPLIVPPDYNLRPPQPGAPSRNIQDPSVQAQSALYSTGPGTVPATEPTYSDAERALLARTGAGNVDPSIRQTIASETGYQSNDAALTDRVLGSGGGAAPAPQPAASTEPAPAPAEPAAQPAPPPVQ